MSRVAFAILAWVFLGLELGLKPALRLGNTEIAPSFVFVLLTFLAMCAAPRASLWSAVVLGLLMDLTSPLATTTGEPPGYVLGPHVIAYALASQLVLAMRGVMIRRNPLTLGFLALTGGVVAQVVLVAIFWLRSVFDPIAWGATGELVTRLGSAGYTGLFGVAFAFGLLPMAEWIGLPTQTQRRFGR